MASTNKTTHYELSQYVGTDKPTYLTDYNQDMSRIDAGIYGAKSLADVNETAIGDLTNLTTTAKTNLVSAINELDGEVATNTGNISTNTTNIDANTTAIGTLSNLTTSAKNNLVSAINEVDANSDSNTTAIGTNTSAIGNLARLTTNVKSDLVSAVNEVNYNVNNFNLTTFEDITTFTVYNSGGSVISATVGGSLQLAKNNDGSLAKIYGSIGIDPIASARKISFQTSLRPTSDININGHVLWINTYPITGGGGIRGIDYMNYTTMKIKTDGVVEVEFTYAITSNAGVGLYFTNSLLFIKDFGDSPIPVPPTL